MGVADIIIVVIVIAVVVVAAIRIVGTARGKRDCCSGDAISGGPSHGRSFPVTHITDVDESHYPYSIDLEVGGMSCERCVANVTNALNSIDGVWATVELAGGRAHVRSKNPFDLDAYRKVIEEAGYRLVAHSR